MHKNLHNHEKQNNHDIAALMLLRSQSIMIQDVVLTHSIGDTTIVVVIKTINQKIIHGLGAIWSNSDLF